MLYKKLDVQMLICNQHQIFCLYRGVIMPLDSVDNLHPVSPAMYICSTKQIYARRKEIELLGNFSFCKLNQAWA
ncbi:MAG: hypothetical protein LBC53_06640 [Spirochaetaceae bacterium]|jgi:hypothetical protein|nr:hypothetical protein [Spirochaetaceae bacterium]